MAKNLLPKIMYRNYNLPKVTAVMHSILLVFLLTAIVAWTYTLLASQISPTSTAEAHTMNFFNFINFFINNKMLWLKAAGLLLGLNGLVYYQVFRLNKKFIAYSISVILLTAQAALVGNCVSML